MGYQIDIDTLKARREPRLPLAGADQDHDGPAEGPEHVLGGRWDYLRVRHHRDRPAAPLPLARRGQPGPSPPPERPRVLPPDRPRSSTRSTPPSARRRRRREHLLPLRPRLLRHPAGGLPERLAGEGALPQVRQDRAERPGGHLAQEPSPSPSIPTASTSTYRERYPNGRSSSATGQGRSRRRSSASSKKLEYEGRKVVREVFHAKDIYSGPLVAKGPDLIVLSEPGFDMKGSVKKKEIFGRARTSRACTPGTTRSSWPRPTSAPTWRIQDIAKIILDRVLMAPRTAPLSTAAVLRLLAAGLSWSSASPAPPTSAPAPDSPSSPRSWSCS